MEKRERICFDANPFISSRQEEIGWGFRPLSHEVDCFYVYCVNNNCVLVLFEIFFEEVEKRLFLSKEEVLETFKELGIGVEVVEEIKEDSDMAGEIEKNTGIHCPDSDYVAGALRVDCDFILTFNKRDFRKVRHLIDVKDPSDFV